MDMTITIGAIASITTISGFGFTIMRQLRTNRRENDADRKADHDDLKNDFAKVQVGLTERVAKLETICSNFMPRNEIEGKIEHEKNNRQMANDALYKITDKLGDDVRSMMITQGRIETQQISTTSSLDDLKVAFKDFSREMGGKFDKMGDSFSDLARKIQH